MDKNYIPPAEAYRKLKLARGLSQNVYMYAATGYGKTTLIRQYLDFHKYEYHDCRDGELVFGECLRKKAREKVYLVIDNLQLLREEEKQREVLKILENPDIWTILIGRARLPVWLKQPYYSNQLMVIEEEDLHFDIDGFRKLVQLKDISLSEEQLAFVVEQSEGNIYALLVFLRYLHEGEEVGGHLAQKIRDEYWKFLDEQVIGSWDTEMQEFLMRLSVVDTFDEPFARFVTGDNCAIQMLQKAMELGSFLFEEKRRYHFRPMILEALRRRGEKKLGTYIMDQCRYNAGRYYEQQEEIEAALAMYEQMKNKENIQSLLIRNGRKNPGVGYYYQLRKYYQALPEEEIEGDIVLMSAMSMMYSILMQEEKSEYWYHKLKTYSKTLHGGEKREAQSRLCYLDIALPHRGNTGILEIIKNSPKLLFSKGISVPEMSVTNNQPSAMNGGKDFCEWSKKDKLLADTIGALLERVLHSYGNGLVNAGLGESFYEKGMDNYLVLKHLMRAQIESQEGGKLEITFVSVGLQVRLSMLSGDEQNAFRLMESFERQVKKAGARQLLPNIEALKCRMALYAGNRAAVDAWMKTAPDENQEFCTLERYRYMTKLRVLILRGEYFHAFSLIEKMRYYAEKSRRTYLQMELGILEAVIRYQRKGDWYEDFMKVLKKLSEYQFIRLLSEEGGLVLPLLKQVKKELAGTKGVLPEKWFMQAYQEAVFMKEHYISYGEVHKAVPKDFKPEEIKVLRLQADGKTIKEIAVILGVKERTVKYWCTQNYAKLEANGKIEAIQKAKAMGIL